MYIHTYTCIHKCQWFKRQLEFEDDDRPSTRPASISRSGLVVLLPRHFVCTTCWWYISTHTYIHIHIYRERDVYIHIYIYTCVYIYIYIHMCIVYIYNISLYIYICVVDIYIYIYIHVYIYIYIYICSICILVYTYRSDCCTIHGLYILVYTLFLLVYTYMHGVRSKRPLPPLPRPPGLTGRMGRPRQRKVRPRGLDFMHIYMLHCYTNYIIIYYMIYTCYTNICM